MDPAAQSSVDAHTGALLVAACVGAGAGWLVSGPLAAIGLAVAGATVVTVVLGARRMRRVGQALDGVGPDLSQLPAKQALAALSAITGGARNFDSPQLRAVERVAEHAASDPAGALAQAQRARAEFPRSPLVAAELARRQQALGHDVEASAEASEAIVLALDGGMNPMAAKLLAEFRGYRQALSLPATYRQRLAAAARAANDDSGAAWCRRDLD